ncbi:aminotransferase class I/II-fold pyridoxal phosphate-dependent enzyme [Bacillus atrophaeus]|uniref:pyridoxal phosphate-dependent decarboxylase family protein n=1 Tax=Bacillus atrophaeus TaxID=1452 RepID=UPI00227EAB10|nr:aminotransferase class I/II-fold pyridoxal phosphate-dependent enzyme [Bacillus atrophaeus]MCY8911619.1 aminotransferase class I/II-fold pyridoxal phosphate-dependent enzyme [Bacillus atrophaeus]MCY9115861.1 aminotransferase class I/II-fold pyridoxal phosphate-dependent enzyme [Bacillus atrophaeus]MEC0926113.1 aminotransferase class I/II-fold pyridoxal phosphate-dependent enzyme [Bacillus atrophaeus]MEC0935349.1 aminotransferase class I/II-fold pyridoxal phosphate-dependent enzyme [Bacillus 
MSENLQLSAEEMRQLGYQAVDLIIDHMNHLKSKPVSETIDSNILRNKLTESIPENGSDPKELLHFLNRNVFNQITHVDHPHFLAFVPGPNNYVGVVADFLASGFNVFPTAWIAGAGAEQIELTTINWLKSMIGFPDSAEGLFVSGGSMANLTALTVARQAKLNNDIENAVVYFSDQTHFSVDRALKVLGFKQHQICRIETDEHLRISVSALKKQIKEDRTKGKKPFCVIANAGTTNCGAVDSLNELADLCNDEDVWLHADGSYGAPAILSEKGSALLQGIHRADSLTLDPHKWLFQPYDVGCVLIRNSQYLSKTFRMMPEYIKDSETNVEGEINFGECGIELSRRFRALKVWLSFKVFGAAAFRQAIDHGIMLAEQVEAFLGKAKDWEVVTPAQLGIVTFRYIPSELASTDTINEINKKLVKEITHSGFAMLSTTELKEKVVIRLCSINPRTTTEEMLHIMMKIKALAEEVSTSYPCVAE